MLRKGERVGRPRWNIARRQAQGERLLRVIGAADVAAARALWKDPRTPLQQRCLAARANGLLGEHGPKWMVDGVDMDDNESPLARARNHGTRDAAMRRVAERWTHQRDHAREQMRVSGARSLAETIGILEDPAAGAERRETAASILGDLHCREAVRPLIEALREGQPRLSAACMTALIEIGSRRHARELIEIARGSYPLPARQEAIYTLWHLRELRAELLLIRLGAAVDSEEEYTRDMATEALGNTWWRPRTQRALAERLFDPSTSVRFAALCAVKRVDEGTIGCLRRALEAKLRDPARVDDHRVIAELAGQLLGTGGRDSCPY